MEFRGEVFTRENSAQTELTLGLLRIQVSIEKDGRWAVGVVQHSDPGLVCRVMGKAGKVLSTEFPGMEAELKAKLEQFKSAQA